MRIFKTNKQRIYSIWCEGFATTGQYGTAFYVGDSFGSNFEDAVRNYFHNHPDRKESLLFDDITLKCWGCNLFPEEKKARKNFG